MEYRNLIYCKHHEGDARAFLYELPLEKDVKTGEKLCVMDRRGEHIVTAYCENWICTDKMTEILCVANGGYFPPAQVVGDVKTVTVTQEIVDRYPAKEAEKIEEAWPCPF